MPELLLQNTEFSEGVITLVPEAKADATNVCKCSAKVGNLHDNGKNIIPFADLNWTGTAHGEAPVAVVLDKFHPVPPGYNACTGHNVRDPLPEDTATSTIHPTTRLWVDGMKYLHDNCEGRSLHVGDHNGPIADTNFHENEDPTPDGEFATNMVEVAPYLAELCAANLRVVLSSNQAVQDNFDLIEDHIIASLQAEANLPGVQNNLNNRVPPAASNPPDQPDPVQNGLMKVLEGLNDSIKMSKEGSKISQKAKNIQLAKNFYMIAFGHKVQGPGGEWILEEATLEPAFIEFLEQTADERALVEIQSGIRHVTNTERQKNTLIGHLSDFNIDTLNKAAVTCFRNYQWHAKPMAHCTPVLDRALSIIQLLPCARLNKAFERFYSSSRASKFDDVHEEDDVKKGAICDTSPFALVPLSSKKRIRKIVDGYFDATTVKEMALLLGHLHCLNNYNFNSNTE